MIYQNHFTVTINDIDIEAPIIKTDFSIVENQAKAIMVLSDDDSPFTYTVSGADANFFTVFLSNGELLFTITEKDYEIPEDANKDNIYEFTVSVDFADSQSDESLNIRVTIEDDDEK